MYSYSWSFEPIATDSEDTNGTTSVMFADFNADGQDDLVQISKSGNWTVSLSNGVDGWGPLIPWWTEKDAKCERFTADLDGDGTADAILYSAVTAFVCHCFYRSTT